MSPPVFRYIACGVDKTGQLVIYNRAGLYDVSQTPCNNCPVMPASWIQVTKEGSSVTSIDIAEEVRVGGHLVHDIMSCFQLIIVGTSDGSVQVYSLVTGQVVASLSQSTSMVYQVRMVGTRILITMGKKKVGNGVNTMIITILSRSQGDSAQADPWR